MKSEFLIPEPFQFNPLKHHFSYIREFIRSRVADETRSDQAGLIRELKQIGTSVMDVYNGFLGIDDILDEVTGFLESEHLDDENKYSCWTGKKYDDFRVIDLSDNSQWMLKYHKSRERFVHLFPARISPHSFRVKANTLKSAIIYYILIGRDYISRQDLNHARELLGLSPIKDPSDAEAITEMIEMLRL